MNNKNYFKKSLKYISYVIGIIAFVLIYEILAFTCFKTQMDEFFINLNNSFILISDINTLKALGYTFLMLIFSVLISFFLAIILGSISGYYKTIYNLLSPTISVLKSMPLIGLILIFISKFKYYEIIVNFTVIFPIIYYQIAKFTFDTRKEYENVLRIEGKNNPIEVLFKVIYPLNKDKIFLILLQVIGVGIKTEIMAETFGYSTYKYGIGKLIYMSYSNAMYKTMNNYITLSIVIALIIDCTVYITKSRIIKTKK